VKKNVLEKVLATKIHKGRMNSVGLTKTKFENKSNKYKKKAFRKILFDEFFEVLFKKDANVRDPLRWLFTMIITNIEMRTKGKIRFLYFLHQTQSSLALNQKTDLRMKILLKRKKKAGGHQKIRVQGVKR